MCRPLDIENKDHKVLVERILNGDVVLFLGSGFSIGAKRKQKDFWGDDDLTIPGVSQLKKILATKLLNDKEMENEKLMEICEECQEDNKSKYIECLRSLFSVGEVCDFHKLYKQISWKQIFTINVDNVVEQIYDDSDALCCIYSADPQHVTRQAIEFYKLHGCVVKKPEEITFSTSDYINNAARRNDCRFEALSYALKTENFLFIGASLSEEWDFDIKCKIEDICTISNRTYFVLKDYDERVIKRLRRKFKNPIFIKETAESFIKKVLEYKKTMGVTSNISGDKWHLREIQRKNYDVIGYIKPDLYLGEEPTWEDVFSNHDVVWEKTRGIIKEIEENGISKSLIIRGKPISGKTTMLYRLGAFLSDNCKVYEYIGSNFVDDLKGYVSQLPSNSDKEIILLDDANWTIGRIKEIIQIIKKTNIKFIASLREKEYERTQHLFDNEITKEINFVKDINNLSRKDIELYLDKLDEKSFLGKYGYNYKLNKGKTVENILKELKKRKEDPLLWLTMKIKYGDRLENRLKEISDSVMKNNNYNIRRFVVLLYFLDVIGGTGLKLALFLELYHMDADCMRQFFSDIGESLISNTSLIGWKHSEYGKIIIHSRLFKIVKNIIAQIGCEELEHILEDIFHNLNFAYHFKCRQPNTYHSHVLYTLLRSQNIKKIFYIVKTQNQWIYINRLYENIHDDYKDYYLYWLHRGISEVKMGKFEAANIHLEQARASRKGYSYEIEHSFAMLNFEEAINSQELSFDGREIKFRKALEIIRSQIERKENDAFCIHSFVTKVIQYYEAIETEIPNRLLNEMLEYYNLARERFTLEQSKIRRDMLSNIYNYFRKHDKLYDGRLSLKEDDLAYLAMKERGGNNIGEDVLDWI